MSDALAAAGPLDGLDISAAGVRIVAAPPSVRWLVQGRAAQAVAARACGLPAPAPMRAQAAGDLAVLWLGPDETLIVAPPGNDVGGRLAAALADAPHGLVDVSQRDAGLDVAGPAAADLLACAVLLDLDPRAFPPGACARTLAGKAPVLLWRRAAETFRLETPRSFAPYLRDLLREGLRGLGPDPD
ncbi:MAG TPA: sarcosine oxidase subunit gamma family protein [Beijerinckiaceae bacterium]|jgi:sarcosine oxidase subunit gamma